MCLDNMFIEKDCIIFGFAEFLKVSRQGHSFTLKVEHLKDEDLCAMQTLKYFPKKTEDIRLSRKRFISYKTYKCVSSCTLAQLDERGCQVKT